MAYELIKNLGLQANLLSLAHSIIKHKEIQQFLDALADSGLLRHCQVDIDVAKNSLIIRTDSDKIARELWRWRYLLGSYAFQIAPTLEIIGAIDEYTFEINAMSQTSHIIAPKLEGDVIKRIDDCPYSCALSTWFDKCLHPNRHIILWPDRPTTPEETIAFFGYDLKGNWHPEDRAAVYRDSKQHGIRECRYRAKLSNGQWAWWTAEVEFLIYRGFESRICTVKDVEPIEGMIYF